MEDFTNLFSEPEIEDESVISDETYIEWLNRNTSRRAKYSRALLNENISKGPNNWQEKLIIDLSNRWSSAFFELVVARVIQEIGASITVEEIQSGRNPDFIADFQNNKITIEATSTITDSEFREFTKLNEDLIRIIETATPENWSFIVYDLPNINYSDSKKEFSKTISEIMSSLPKIDEGNSIEVAKESSKGKIHLNLFYKKFKAKRLAGAMYGETYGFTDRIAKSMSDKRKRKQAKGSIYPVILAINFITERYKNCYSNYLNKELK